jgi:hypothetical protein
VVREALQPLARGLVDIHAGDLSAKIGAAMLAAVAAAAMVANTVFFEPISWSRLMIILGILLSLHILTCPRLLLCREVALYAAFVGYLLLALLWTRDVDLAMNTIYPAIDFLLILLLFGSLISFQDPSAVLVGALIGFLAGAGAYTYSTGFPLAYPKEFSYNAIAAMYLFGLFVALVFGFLTRFKVLSLVIAVVVLVHILATSSIKSNLGILLGAGGVAVVYFRQTARLFGRNLIYLALAAAVIAYVISTNDEVRDTLRYAFRRVSLGLDVLRTREDVPGYSGFGERQYWMTEGLRGWTRNPLFGHGVEAFRADYGITSHSTPVDLLYNTGLIGLSLFYAMYASIAWRLFTTRSPATRNLRAVLLAGLICQMFVILSATAFYQAFLAGFTAISTALLRRLAAEDLARRDGRQ